MSMFYLVKVQCAAHWFTWLLVIDSLFTLFGHLHCTVLLLYFKKMTSKCPAHIRHASSPSAWLAVSLFAQGATYGHHFVFVEDIYRCIQVSIGT